MPIKISELNPINPLLSYCTGAAEEAMASVRDIPAIVADAFTGIASSFDYESCLLECCAVLERASIWLARTVIILPISAAIVSAEASYDLLVSLVSYIWDTFIMITGGNPTNNNLSPAALSAARDYAINRSRIAEIPQADSLDCLTLAEVGISLDDLLNEHDRLLGTTPVFGFSYAGTERRHNLQSLISFTRHRVAYGVHPLYFENLERLLLNIILELRQAKPGDKRAVDTINGLADAAYACDPRKYKETKRHFERMTGRGGANATERLDQHILRWLKAFKEDLITERYQGSQFHVLNNACSKVRDWGLGGDEVELSDQYINWADTIFNSGLNYRYTLNRGYTPARIIDVVKTRLEHIDYNELITPYFEEIQATLPENYEHELCDRNGKLNHQGVAWLLWNRGFLSSRIPIM